MTQELDPSDGLIVFTDGSSHNNGDRSGGWAWVALDAFDGVREGSGGVHDTTNNRMEMTAAAEALFVLGTEYGPLDILIQSDSEYLVKGFMDKTRSRRTNLDLWDDLEEVAAAHSTVVMEHVKGHAGHQWNERADKLAGEARRELVKTSAASPQEGQ